MVRSKNAENQPIRRSSTRNQEAANPPLPAVGRGRTKTTAPSSSRVNTSAILTTRYNAPFQIHTEEEGDLYLSIKEREMVIPFQIDFDDMESLGIKDEVERYLDILGLLALSKVSHHSYDEITREFFSTLKPVSGSPTSISFRINNTSHTLSVEDLVEMFGMRGTGLMDWDQNFDQVEIWRELTDHDDYRTRGSKINEIKDIAIVVFLKWFGHSFGGRSEYSKVAKSDLLALNAILHPEIEAYQVNTAYRLLKRLREVPTELSKIGYGFIIRALAEKYNCMPTASTLATFETILARSLNINHLDVAGFVKKGRVIPYNRRVRLVARTRREAVAREEEGGEGRRAGKEPAGTSQAGEAAHVSVFDQRFSELVEQNRTGWEQNRVGWETNQKLLEDIRREQHVGLAQLQWRQDRMRARLNRQEDFLRGYFNAAGGERYPSPEPSPDPPAFD
ncbi:uncharacterized protein LOC126656273 [Mercurialis annua]|uniref:uncharacterized protein LOC126656273 n=1 Tax=Mercurialis annua TaxID=3986 RepID=UPI00215FC65A|nr:uncharacterized protein LOC126656273 [Mercurialis annua]XP_050206750.1 uncharacterized protein LOC126656273 [Mercurialis annua]XP_050206752.1 uncharacterized protein LOC126656273 [Mercurialis annua]XP_055959631.1 uncharacterized protein LOC126656273 [Mercurialis annua]